MTHSSKSGFTHDERRTAARRIACSFPRNRGGIRLAAGDDPIKGLLDYLTEHVHQITSSKRDRDLIELVVSELIDDGIVRLNRRRTAWLMVEKYRRHQIGRAHSISKSHKERAYRRRATRRYDTLATG